MHSLCKNLWKFRHNVYLLARLEPSPKISPRFAVGRLNAFSSSFKWPPAYCIKQFYINLPTIFLSFRILQLILKLTENVNDVIVNKKFHLCKKNCYKLHDNMILHACKTHIHTRLTAFCPALPGWAHTRKVKPIWILLKQETVSGSGISWAICKSAPRSRQVTILGSHHSVFYKLDALPATQPTVSKHWRQSTIRM